MTVYVDNFRAPARVGRLTARWSHLVADTPEELHAFAASLGLLRSWFQDKEDGRWHYDVTDTERAAAIALGAKSIDIREMGAITSARARAVRDARRAEAVARGEACDLANDIHVTPHVGCILR